MQGFEDDEHLGGKRVWGELGEAKESLLAWLRSCVLRQLPRPGPEVLKVGFRV